MADYWTKKDASRPEDEWQLPLDHPDNPDNPDSQGNKLKAATQALSDRLAQEKHSLGKRDELMVFTYQGDLERVRFVLKAERARGSRKKPSTVRGERAARRVSVDTPQ